MIIVESVDGGGKTTLVNTLCERFNLVVGERRTHDRKKLYTVTRQDTYTHLSQAILGRDRPKVMDRLYYSELVYANLVGRECEFAASERALIEGVIEALGCPVIVCLPPFEVVEKYAADSEQMDGVLANLEHIYNRYSHPEFPWPSNTIVYDWTETDPEKATLKAVLDEVAGYMELREERQSFQW